MRKILSFVAVLLCAAACIYPYTPELEKAPEGILAVDGNISIGEQSVVLLSALYPLWPDDFTERQADFSDAKVWVEDDAGEKYPGVPLDSGASGYSSGAYGTAPFAVPTENAPADRRYRLCVEALGGFYASDWSDIPEPPVIKDIEFSANDYDVVVNVSVDGGENGTGYLLLSYDETWEFHTEWYLYYTFDPGTREILPATPDDYDEYWCWKSSDSGRTYPIDYTGMTENGIYAYPLLSFSRYDNRNHRRYSVNVKARTISPASYRFLKNLESNTEGGDNLFTPNPGEIAGNLRCESDPERTVLGYVVVYRAAEKRAFLDSRYLRARRPNEFALMYLLEDRYLDFWEEGYKPLYENTNPDRNPELEGPYGWGGPSCYDCRASGGTKTKPDFWDDPE